MTLLKGMHPMTPTTIGELDVLLSTLKKHEVRAFALGELQVSFVEPDEEKDDDSGDDDVADAMGFQVEVGRDGLTQDEQTELYGAPIDSNFHKGTDQ